MIELEERLRAELDRLVEVDSRRDWEDVVARAGLKRGRARRRWLVGGAAVAAAAILGIATPLGAAIARGVDDFSAWLTGEPGAPVSEEEQREFERGNVRTWLGFPDGTKLRRLITQEANGMMVELLGFRSGSSALCLQLRVTGESRETELSCAPLADLRREGGPARVVLADHGVGRGEKTDWYGTDLVHSSKLQITAGIASDGVMGVVLEDDAGRHEVPTRSNAFLYVAEDPEVGQRVRRVWARTPAGLVPLPFAPTPFGFGGGAPARTEPPAPAIERQVTGGRIGWLEDQEARGEALHVLPARVRAFVLGGVPSRAREATDVIFGRVLAPDPDRPLRLVMTLNAHRPGGPPAGLCTWLVGRGSGGGGCSPYPEVFEGSPMRHGMMGGGSGGFVTVHGVASDDVVRLEALLADDQRVDVPLEDNAFLVDLPRAKLPARLVAYDDKDRVIGVSRPWHDIGSGPGPAKGRAVSLLRVTGADGAHAELLVGPATDGGECKYVKHFVDPQHAGTSVSCYWQPWASKPLQLGSQFQPPRFVDGRVRDDVKTVRIRFADGSSVDLEPTRGYVLWAAQAEQLKAGRGAVGAVGLDRNGGVIDEFSFRPPRGMRTKRR
jgi:hypothetical protein